MSKKRRSSLDSKWKLSKVLNDYKQHKQNKKAAGVGYSEEPEIVPSKKRSRFGGKVCKKTGGEHVWKLAPHKISVMRNSYNFYKCDKCCKEYWQAKYRYVCAKCGSEESWLWAILRDCDKRICKKCDSREFREIPNPNLENNEKQND